MATTWKRLTRQDLTAFDKHATDLILAASSTGAVGRVTARGHAMLRHPHGETAITVPKNMSAWNRTAKNAEADFRRIFGPLLKQQGEQAKEKEAAMAATQKEEQPVAESLGLPTPNHPHTPTVVRAGKFYCPVKQCKKVFKNDGDRALHILENHKTCDVKGCHHEVKDAKGKVTYAGPYVSLDLRGLRAHERFAHNPELKARIDAAGAAKRAELTAIHGPGWETRAAQEARRQQYAERQAAKNKGKEQEVVAQPVEEVEDKPKTVRRTRKRHYDAEALAQVVADARVAAGWSVSDLARAAHVADNTIRRLEHGDYINRGNVHKITYALDLNMDGTPKGQETEPVELSVVGEVDPAAVEVQTEPYLLASEGIGSLNEFSTDDLLAELGRRFSRNDELEKVRAERDDLQAKLDLMRETLGL